MDKTMGLSAGERKIIICDLDGTLADLTHRRYHVERPPAMVGASTWRPDWKAFHDGCVDDTPLEVNILVVQALLAAHKDSELWIVSGRSNAVRQQTIVWLNTHLDCYDRLIMRPEGDFMRDDLLKEGWLMDGTLPHRRNVLCVFDDRKRVVDMWRKHGLTCYQVADGDF